MFGYISVDLPNLYVKDTVLYKALYCGLCKGIGGSCGQCGRLALSYDLTFLSAFIHNICGVDVDIKNEHCALHIIKKRPIAKPDNYTNRIGALNVILAYYKLTDDILDNNKGKVKRSLFNKVYKKCKKREPVLDKIVKDGYEILRKYEKENLDSIDRVADPFSTIVKESVKEIAKEFATEEVLELSYNLGKWIYLIDALDDFDQDKKKKTFNVFVNAYLDIDSKDKLIKEKGSDLAIIFGTVLNDIISYNSKVKYVFNHDLIDNILVRGLTAKTKTVMENKKCKNIIRY